MTRKLILFVFIVLMAANGAAESFGSETGPLPNLTEIRIYDVTEAVDKETGGTLLDSGLNKTFEISQVGEREYRFTFEIRNDGGQDWTIASDDEMYHGGLNTSWNVNNIWYNVSSTQYSGGSFSEGDVSWDTSNQGTLSTGESMYSNYIVNIAENQTWSYDQFFKVNDTSNMSGSQDDHELNVTKYGDIEVELLEPPNDTVVQKNRMFLMNSSATCRNGECGEVSLTARYNNTESSFTSVPENSGSPFYTNNSSTQTCEPDLKKDETCYVSWFVNATGDSESYHLLDAEVSSTVPEVSDNDSENHLVQINKILMMDLDFNTIDFGVIDPGEKNNSAEGNSELLYNVTVDEESNTIDDLWIRVTDLDSNQEDYTIPAENLSYGLENDITAENFLSNTYQHVKSDLSPGTVLNTFHWIDVPYGIYKGGYTGTMYFKANSTG